MTRGILKPENTLKYIATLILFGSCVYALCYYSNLLPVAQTINILVVFLCMGLALINLMSNRYFINSVPLLFMCLCVGNMFISGLIQNSLLEIIPTAIRYCLYLFTANLCYFLVKNQGIASYYNVIKSFNRVGIVLTVSFVCLEVLLNDVDYLNGAYRVAGSFKKHQLGEAMFVFILLIYNIFLSKRDFKNNIISLVLLIILFSTQSRALIGVIFCVGMLYYILKLKSLWKLVVGLAIISLILIGAYYVIIYTDILPRFKVMLLSDDGMYDSSTLERVEIMENSLNNIKGVFQYIGIGIGGFQQFYYDITGRDAVAAHNNYLLFYIEGGYISLIAYILFQVTLGASIIKRLRISNSPIVGITFFFFMGITVMSFLLNNYYFYCSETMVWSSIGAYLGFLRRETNFKKYYEKNIIFSSK